MSDIDRSKIKGRPRPPKPPLKPLQATPPIDSDMWMRDERLLGRLVMEWSRLEGSIQGLVWAFAGLSNEEGKILTSKMDVGFLLQALRGLATLKLKTELLAGFLSHINAAEEIKDARNLAVHGIWHRLGPDRTPAAMSIRNNIEPGKGFAISETFPEGKIYRLVESIRAIRRTFVAIEAGLLSSPETLLIQHHSD